MMEGQHDLTYQNCTNCGGIVHIGSCRISIINNMLREPNMRAHSDMNLFLNVKCKAFVIVLPAEKRIQTSCCVFEFMYECQK